MHLHNEEEYKLKAESMNDKYLQRFVYNTVYIEGDYFNIYDLLEKYPQGRLFIKDKQDNFYEVTFESKAMKVMKNSWPLNVWDPEIRKLYCIYHKIQTHEFDRKHRPNKPDLVYLSFGESSKQEENYPEYMSSYILRFAPFGFVICENS